MTGPAESAVAAALAGIERENARINAFACVFGGEARSAAPAGPLAGRPFAAKELFDVAGLPTRAGSSIRADAPPAARDATAIARLREAGAVLVGLTHMDEFAYGFTGENAHWGAVRNPRDPERIAGGSSSGSAAAVAAGLVPFALGSDTNGSVRVPAALCGIWGLKPTYGRISRAGVAPLAWSFDHVGVLAAAPEDIAAAVDAMQGPIRATRRRGRSRPIPSRRISMRRRTGSVSPSRRGISRPAAWRRSSPRRGASPIVSAPPAASRSPTATGRWRPRC